MVCLLACLRGRLCRSSFNTCSGDCVPIQDRLARNFLAPVTVVALLPSACAAAMIASSFVLAVVLVSGAGVCTVNASPCLMTALPRMAVLSPFHQSAPTCSLAHALLAWVALGMGLRCRLCLLRPQRTSVRRWLLLA